MDNSQIQYSKAPLTELITNVVRTKCDIYVLIAIIFHVHSIDYASSFIN